MSGPIPATLGNLQELQNLYLHNNQLSGSIPPELGNISSLKLLMLGENDLTGPVPAELGNLDNLTMLVLHINDLSGSIPSELGNMDSLQSLWLSHNDLSGSIPAELGNLDNLTHLYLNNSGLSGCIPATLQTVANTDIASLNLPFCEDATATPTATATDTPTATATPEGFMLSGSGTGSDPYIVSAPTDVSAHSILDHVADLGARESIFYRWDVGDRAGEWTITTDASPTSHDFDLYGRDDRGSGWDDQDLSSDGDESITVDVLAGGHIYLRVKNYDGGAPTDLTLNDRGAGRG